MSMDVVDSTNGPDEQRALISLPISLNGQHMKLVFSAFCLTALSTVLLLAGCSRSTTGQPISRVRPQSGDEPAAFNTSTGAFETTANPNLPDEK